MCCFSYERGPIEYTKKSRPLDLDTMFLVNAFTLPTPSLMPPAPSPTKAQIESYRNVDFNRVMRLLLLLFALATAVRAHAQDSLWLDVDYSYSDITFNQPNFVEKGRFAGVRGELGLALFSNLAVSVGGEYQDGNFTANGTTMTGAAIDGVTKDYIRDTRAMLNLIMGQSSLAAGIAQREWYNVLPAAYRQREIYNYYPITLTLGAKGLYIKAEYDIWKSGTNKSYMSDLSASEKDVNFTQGSGSAMGAEIGYQMQSASHFATRVYINYKRWDVNDSSTQNDNVYNLIQAKSNTVTIQGGVGVGF
jgi:hypothetical protein